MSESLVRMPKLADTLVEGTLGQWLKQVGEQVHQGEPLASIETDKVTTELTSPAQGTLLEHLVAEGQTVPIDTAIARIGTPTEKPSPESPDSPVLDRSAGSAAVGGGPGSAAMRHASPATASPALGAEAEPVARKPTPVAARLLAEHGLQPAQVPARAGRLTKHDVLNFVQRPQARGTYELVPLTSMRRAIAEHMTRAYQTIPHGQTVLEADLSQLVAWRDAHKDAFAQREGANLTFTVFFVYALAQALTKNASRQRDVHLGVAVALEAGLIVPVLKRADTLGLAETARAVADLATRARTNRLKPDETQGAQMTVTNVGSFGNLTAAPIIPMGQSAILGPGLVERRPLPAANGGIRLGWRCLLTLMFDRRAIDAFTADKLLREIALELTRIQELEPEQARA